MARYRYVPRTERAPRQALKASVRLRVFARDSYTCQYCGQRAPGVPLVVDHVRPLARGGTNDEGNLVTACATCNLGKYANLIVPAEQHRRWEEIYLDAFHATVIPEDPSCDALIPREDPPFPNLSVDAAWLAAHCGGTADGAEAIRLT